MREVSAQSFAQKPHALGIQCGDMSKAFELLASQLTPMGEISLRRRLEPTLLVDVYEVKLGDEFLMTSLFTAGEVALAELGLAATTTDQLDVIVGGLGLGYTARAALNDPRVQSLQVIDALGEVIDWHRDRLIPHSAELTDDQRCQLIHGDFFSMVSEGIQPTPEGPARFDAILVDIDHSPQNLLNPQHASFYQPDGLRRVVDQLHPGGVFGLWSDDPPDDDFLADLNFVFDSANAYVVSFPNFYTNDTAHSTIYVAVTSTEP